VPDAPDFDQIARQLAADGSESGIISPEVPERIAEQLRLVWNARGAADTQAVEGRIRELVAGEVIGAGIARHVAEAIRKVDR
jgi:predicted fused transcriptional regulator/phosphomethylpyrimidine kinase